MKIELDIVGLIQHLDLVDGSVRCIALLQSPGGEVTELPVSEEFAERVAAQHAAKKPQPRGLPQSAPVHAPKVEAQEPEAEAMAVLNAIELDADYNPSEEEFELLARAGIDLVALIQQGAVVPGCRDPRQAEDAPREFGLEAQDGPAAPALGTLLDALNDDPAEEATATSKVIAGLRDKAKKSPRAPRTVESDEAGNPVVEQRPRVVPRKGGPGGEPFGQG